MPTGNEGRILSVYLPSSITSGNEPTVLPLAILDDAQLTGSKKSITRSYRDANGSDPGRIRRVSWEIWGPIGASIESSAGGLRTDWSQNLETRWERRLISAGAQNAVTLTGDDPPGAGAVFDTAIFDTAYFSGASTGIGGQDVVVFDEQQDYLFASRGALCTQIGPLSTGTWSVVESEVFDANIRDAASWRGTGKLAMGSTLAMQRRTGASAAGATYADVTATSPSQTVYANAIKRGSDRAWYIDANEGGTTFNYAGYALDDFVTLASPFQVGDPEIGTTGIGPFGPLTFFGAEDNIYSFTDQGKPVPLSRALLNFLSDHNGAQFADPGWGWNYVMTSVGLRAQQPGVDNPVGIGERMRGFTGHNGTPHAIGAFRGELWVIYQTSGGALYGYRGTFGPETAGTGQPLFFPWFYQSSGTSGAPIFSSDTTPLPVVIKANGTNLTYQVVSANGRDDLDPNYVYSTAGGVWWGTTLDRDPNLLKTLRLMRFRTRSLTSGSSWQAAMAFDPNPVASASATYVNIGSAVTTNGAQTIYPITGTSPTANISGRTMKPRFTQVAGGSGASTTPPEIDGTLDVEYDERPEQIEEITAVINMTGTGYSSNYIWDTLKQLLGSTTDGPYQIQLPDDLPPGVSTASGGGKKYAMLASVTKRDDLKDPSIEGVQVVFTVWPAADQL